jgi:chromosome segregation ATPase
MNRPLPGFPDDDWENPEHINKFLDYLIHQSRERLDVLRRQCEMDPDEFERIRGDEIPMPEWFPRPQLYHELLVSYHEAFLELRRAREGLKAALAQLRRSTREDADAGQARELESLERRHRQLLEEKRRRMQVRQTGDSRRELFAVSLQHRVAEHEALRQRVAELEEDRAQHEATLRQCMEMNDTIAHENETIRKALQQSTVEINRQQSAVQQTQQDVEELIRRRNENQKKNEALMQQMKALESARVEAEYRIRHLQEQMQDHDKMLEAFDLANKQLARERGIEQAAIAKMKEAVNSAEEFKAEAERLRRESSSIREEVVRAKQNLTETLTSLKQGAKRKVDAINQGYEGRIVDADKQLTQLLNDNAQFAASIEVMRRQLQFLESQNSLLRTGDVRGKGAFDEFTRGATGQLEMLNGQLEELTRESQRLREEEQRQKAKLANAEMDSERSSASVRKSVDRLENDIAQVKAKIAEAEAHGKALFAENSRLSSELTRVEAESKRDVDVRISEKDNEIRMLQSRLDEMRRTHIHQTGELQKVLLENKRHADRWKEAAESVAVESEQGLEQAEQRTQQFAQKVAAYNVEIQRQEAEAAALHELIAKRQQEARDLQRDHEVLERKLFEENTQLEALYEQQMQFASQRELMQNEIDQKKIEHRRLKRQYAARARQEPRKK